MMRDYIIFGTIYLVTAAAGIRCGAWYARLKCPTRKMFDTLNTELCSTRTEAEYLRKDNATLRVQVRSQSDQICDLKKQNRKLRESFGHAKTFVSRI